MVGDSYQLLEHAPWCFVWSKLWPWKGLIQAHVCAFNLGTCKKATNRCLSFFPQQQTLFSTAWKHCTGCEVIVRWAHAFLFWPCLPTTMCSTYLHLFIFTSSYSQWYRDIPWHLSHSHASCYMSYMIHSNKLINHQLPVLQQGFWLFSSVGIWFAVNPH